MLIFNDLTVSQYTNIRNGSGLSPVDSGLVIRALVSSAFTLRYECGGETVGMLRVVGDGAFVAVICDVVVLPGYRRQGIGTNMINAALERIGRDMPHGMRIPVMLTCSVEREDFYKSFGFVALNRDIQGVAMQAFVMGTAPV
jgi:ribosomal protein S18 acetylase RimI-like enzyme